jgi:hypothetical protein
MSLSGVRVSTIVIAVGCFVVSGLAPSSLAAAAVASPPVPRAMTVDAVDPLGPVPPGSIPAIPATGVPVDQVVALVDGSPVPVVRLAEDQGTLVEIQAGSGSVYVGAEPPSGEGIARLGRGGVLRLPPGGGLFHTGPDGSFQPGSAVRYYLYGPAEVDLGQGRSGPEGNGDIDGVSLPADLPAGAYTVQIASYDATGRARSVFLGAQVHVDQRPVERISWPRRVDNPGTTRLLKTPIVTNAGHAAKVRVHCTVIDTSIEKPGLCRTRIDAQGWLRVTLPGTSGVWIWVDLSAPGAPGYSRYSGGRILRAPLRR